MPLSPREQRILAGIERDLGQEDPALATTFATTRTPSSAVRREVRRWFPLSLVDTGLLVLILVVLVAAYPAGVELGLPWVGLLTAVLVVPWLLRTARSGPSAPVVRRRRAVDDPAPSDTRNDR